MKIVFPVLPLIFPGQEDQMLDPNERLAQKFIANSEWRNFNNKHMRSASPDEWKEYQRHIWVSNRKMIKQAFNDARTGVYNGAREAFIDLFEFCSKSMHEGKQIVFPSLETILHLYSKEHPLLSFIFYDRFYRYVIGKRKWEATLENADDSNAELPSPAIKAVLCYHLKNNYWTWVYTFLCEKASGQFGDYSMKDLLVFDYDICNLEVEDVADKYIRYNDMIEAEAKYSESERCFEMIDNTSDEYASMKAKRHEFEMTLASNSKEAHIRLDMIRKKVAEDRNVNKGICMVLKGLGKRVVNKKRKRVSPSSDKPELELYKTAIIAKVWDEQMVQYILNHQSKFKSLKATKLPRQWEMMYYEMVSQYGQEPIGKKKKKKKQLLKDINNQNIDWKTMCAEL